MSHQGGWGNRGENHHRGGGWGNNSGGGGRGSGWNNSHRQPHRHHPAPPQHGHHRGGEGPPPNQRPPDPLRDARIPRRHHPYRDDRRPVAPTSMSPTGGARGYPTNDRASSHFDGRRDGGWSSRTPSSQRQQQHGQSSHDSRSSEGPGRHGDQHGGPPPDGVGSSQYGPGHIEQQRQQRSSPLRGGSNGDGGGDGDGRSTRADAVAAAAAATAAAPPNESRWSNVSMVRTGGDEAQKPRIPESWMEMGTDDRVGAFALLDWEKKLDVQGFPPQAWERTPLPHDFPDEVLVEEDSTWAEKKRTSAIEALEALTASISQFVPDNAAPIQDDNYYESDEEMDDRDECEGPPYCHCVVCSNGGTVQNKRDSMLREISPFFRALPCCLLFEAGFRAKVLHPDDENRCWCPCGKYMVLWRKGFHVDVNRSDHIKDAVKICGDGSKKKTPQGLMDHLRTQGVSCPLHWGVAKYLENLYGDMYGNIGHKALYHVNDKKWRLAEAAMNRCDERERRMIHQQLAEAKEKNRILEEEQKKQEKKLEELGKVNLEQKKKLERSMERWKILGVSKGSKAELSDHDLESFNFMYECFVDREKLRNANKVPKSPIKIFVDNKFCLQHLFDTLSGTSREAEDKSFLFRELSSPQGVHHHAPKLIAEWVIQFRDEYRQSERAVDDGGPTREFFSRTWDQIQTLKVTLPGSSRQIELFEETEVGYIPVINDKFYSPCFGAAAEVAAEKANEDQGIIEKAKKYYRAIGRVMLHSLMTKHCISDRAMPRFYQNVLFRECNFEDGRYPRNEILEDLEDMSATDDELSCYVGHKLGACGIEGDDADVVITPDLFFTKVVDHQHVRSRSIGLGAIKEGLTLNGYVDVQRFFRGMPVAAISKLVFAKAKVDPEDVIRVLHPTYLTEDHGYGPQTEENQKYFVENVLKHVIRDRANVDSEFLPDFVRNCTGLSYVPHALARPDYRITISFSFQEMDNDSLPVAHTCTKELKLPGGAYNGNREIFEQKLDQSLDAFRNMGFGMT